MGRKPAYLLGSSGTVRKQYSSIEPHCMCEPMCEPSTKGAQEWAVEINPAEFPGGQNHIKRAIEAAGFNPLMVIPESVTLHVEAIKYESLHAHGFWRPGTVITNRARSRLTFDVQTASGVESHEIPYENES